MRFNIANKAPISVTIEGIEYQLPPVRRRFWINWAAEIDGQRTTGAIQHLSPAEGAKMLLIYPVEPTMHSELVKRIHTPEGTGRIIRESATKADPKVPDDVLNRLLEDGDEKQLETLAIMLAAVVDFAERQEQETKNASEGEEVGESPDPLASSTKGSTG